MASRLKEDEKNEKIIRSLLKLPSNRKCINCNILGPQYVCTTFSTFVCTTCGGIHREFTHRVKSVSMAKFTPQEIASLQAGGNERAKEIYFKEWDPQRNPAPDSSNADRLRDFIKHVYVNRRYAGEKSERPPQGEKEESNENRRSDGYQSGSRSPPYDDTYERRYSDKPSPGYDVRRSPGYSQDNQRHSDYGRSPVRPSGIVNDWRREDRFANGRKSEDRRSSDGESKPEIMSPDRQKDSNISSPPIVRPVRDILGDNVIPLRISEPPRANTDGLKLTQRNTSSSSLVSTNSAPQELKRETSLIDFDAEPEPALTTSATQAHQPSANQSVAQPTSAPQSDDNWASFNNFPEHNVSQTPPKSNSLESVLTQLSAPSPAHESGSTRNGAPPTPSNGLFPPVTTLSSFPSGGAQVTPGLPSTLPVNGGISQWSGMPSQLPSFPHAAVSQPAALQPASSFPRGSHSQGPAGNPDSQAIPTPAAKMVEVKSSGRKELPMDLFAPSYSTVPYRAPGWQAGVVPGMGYPPHYNPAMLMPTYPQPTKSSNPFDNAEASPVPAGAFPSMTSLQAVLPNMAAPRGLVHTSANLGTPTPSWMPAQLSNQPTMPTLAPSFGSAMPGGTYMGQQLPSNMTSSRPQGFGSFGSQGPAFGSLNFPATAPNPSTGGNPFG